jgi:hypothetical protein
MSKASAAAGMVVLMSVLSAPVFGGVEAVEERPMTLEEIVDAVNSGVSEEVLRLQIEEGGCDCRTGGVRGAVALQRLKEAGVSDDFIRFLIQQGERPRGEPAPVRRVRPTAEAPEKPTAATVFGGYSFGRTYGDAGEENLHGWNAGLSVAATDWLSVAGDVSGHYIDFEGLGILKANIHTFAMGPQFSTWGRTRRTRGFGRFLVGAGRTNLWLLGESGSDTGLAFVTGGGLDVGVGRNVAVRVFQSDWVHIRHAGDLRINMLRLSFGLTGRF